MVQDVTNPGERGSAVLPRWLWLLSLLAAVLMALQSLGYSYGGAGLEAGRGSHGLRTSYDCDAEQFCRVSEVRPASPAARVGLRPDDAVRRDRYWEQHRLLYAGDRIGLTVRRDGVMRHLTLPVEPRAPPFWATYVVGGLISFAVCMVALLVLARAGRRWPGLFLGLALVAYGLPGNYPRFWQNDPALYPWFLTGLSLWMVATPVLMLLALKAFRAETISTIPRWLDRLVWAVALTELVILVWGLTVEFNLVPVLGVNDGLSLLSLGGSAGSVIGPVALAAGWRDVPAESRTRYAFMWTAVSVISIYAIIDPLIMLTGNNYAEASWPVVIQLAALLLGAILFAYALLRHRVIDLGFAINRTLVFSTISFLVLLAFGLVEWGTEKLLPFESHEASVLIDAGIALGLFLAFHRIHGWVERTVERVFFHEWHANEAQLRDFLRLAPYISSADVLTSRSVAELQRFTGGSEVAIYRSDENGPMLVAGGVQEVPARLQIDHPAMVTMRADLTTVHDAFVTGGLALPMPHRAEVTGLVVLSVKPDGNPYRPDEEAQLIEAVRRIGLDLYALRVEELEQANARLSARLELAAA